MPHPRQDHSDTRPAVLCLFALFGIIAATPSHAAGINLSWSDCGLSGTENRTFACNTNTGIPFTMIASFDPPPGVQACVGITSELFVETAAALPDWWKHGTGECRGSVGLQTNFDFTAGPFTCIDPWFGQAIGSTEYTVGYVSPNRARVLVQASVPADNAVSVDPGVEWYAFKLNLLRSRTVGAGSCTGCSTPATITLDHIQLIQVASQGYDPLLTAPLQRKTITWQGGVQSNAPDVQTFTPTAGAPGQIVTLRGLRFTGANGVRFGGEAATFSVPSDSVIHTTVPAGALTGPIQVFSANGTGTSPGSFTVAPLIQSFSPTQGPAGTIVTIYGFNFTGTQTVKLNSTPLSFTLVSDRRLTTEIPGGATDGPFTVTNPGGSTTSAASFDVAVGPIAPQISGFTPAGGPAGTIITISGVGFTGTNEVRIGANAVLAEFFTIDSDQTVHATAPPGFRSGPVYVTNPQGTATSSDPFFGAPVVESFTPQAGGQNTFITISGYNFESTSSVRFNGRPAAFSLNSSQQIQASVPSLATDGPITVSNPYGTGTSPQSFNVLNPPGIDSFSPVEGTVGAIITITGHDFAAVSEVAFNGTPAAFTTVSEQRIDATVPSGAIDGRITVTTPQGTATSAQFFHVVGAGGGSINLSWDDCGTFGSALKTFDCATNSGVPFSLVASFDPPSGVEEFLGISSTIQITTQTTGALPDWWKHGSTLCRGTSGLSTNFDFTAESNCVDFYAGQAAGGFAYDIHPTGTQALLRVQAAVPIDNRGVVTPGTEYYAFKTNLLRAKSNGTGSCAGCSTPMRLELLSIQLFQHPERNFDPDLRVPRDRTVALWQEQGTAVQASLVRSDAASDRVSLEWQLSDALRAMLYRREGDGPWTSLGMITANGSRRASFEDRTVTPGATYHYRLGLDVSGVEVFAGETSVHVPEASAVLAIERAAWEGNGIALAFSLPVRGSARLEVYDVGGRRVMERSLDGLSAGRHEVSVRALHTLGSGVYFARLWQNQESAARRFVLWR